MNIHKEFWQNCPLQSNKIDMYVKIFGSFIVQAPSKGLDISSQKRYFYKR